MNKERLEDERLLLYIGKYLCFGYARGDLWSSLKNWLLGLKEGWEERWRTSFQYKDVAGMSLNCCEDFILLY
jgi:hypothetical protein